MSQTDCFLTRPFHSGNVCRCGNALANRKADAAACNRACPDASSQTCGGR
jgi:hypothetical protein